MFVSSSLIVRLLRNRKGQIRGVDFQLSMLIFLLVFTAIVAMLAQTFTPSSFRTSSLVDQSLQENIATNIVRGSGCPANWGTTSSQPDVFGLGSFDGQDLDIGKLSRLSTEYSAWKIDYTTAKESLGMATGGFSVEVRAMFEISADLSVVAVDSNITVSGDVVDRSDIGVSDARVWVYVLDSLGALVSDNGTTDTDGLYSFEMTINLLASPYVAVAISSVHGIHQDFAIGRINEFGAEEPLGRDSVVIPHANSTSVVDVHTDAGAELAADLYVFHAVPLGVPFPGNNQSMVLNAGDFHSTMAVPPNGTSVLVTVKGSSVSYTATPMPCCSKFGGMFGPYDSLDWAILDFYTTVFLSSINGIPLEVKVWTW